MPALWNVALKAAFAAYDAIGLDVDRIRVEAGIDQAQLDDPDARIPLDRAALIWPAAQRQWGRAGVGLAAGAAVPFGALHVMDYGFATAPTFADGLRTLARYTHIASGGLTGLTLDSAQSTDDQPTQANLYLEGYAGELRDYAAAMIASRIHRSGHQLLHARLVGDPLVDPAVYRRTFGCPVDFAAARDTLVVTLDDSRTASPAQLPGLRDIVEREAERLLNSLPTDDTLFERARRELAAMLPHGAPTLGQLATRLDIAPRTLQRALGESGTPFSALLRDTRHQLALDHLAEPNLSIAEIAYLLGYSEPSAFSRAFKQWAGQSAADQRRAAARV